MVVDFLDLGLEVMVVELVDLMEVLV